MTRIISLVIAAIILAAAVLPALSIPLDFSGALAATAHAKRIVDIECTMLPEDQKPDRCFSGQPLIKLPHFGSGPLRPVSFKRSASARVSAREPTDDLVRRIVDIECTFLPEAQKPSRCFQPHPFNGFRGVSKVAARSTTENMNAKRIVDVDCTFLPEDQKPARCFQTRPFSPLRGVSKVAARSIDHFKRLLDYECTFLPEDQKPARCSQSSPLAKGRFGLVL
ncbi:hypothetical protein BXZ70DRAFT_1010233 [Cristinia sonorae]|uniref:Uncharacterized protein n=1 Tax=Cristinia sonorae TaxID=1940300 RepID=A0A8K0UJ08_9AGAR|nr:hypothetical protein BXZ70DRAFT_1010233 [Cristinia sonorae]